MNKDKWISVELAVVPEETILLLLEMSFDATVPKAKKPKAEDHKLRKTYPERFFRDLGITPPDRPLTQDSSLQEVGIRSSRIFNGLWKYGIKTAYQFFALPGEEKIPNIGARTWEEI